MTRLKTKTANNFHLLFDNENAKINFLVAGMFMDPNSIVIVLMPLVLPMAKAIGIDLIHLGIVIVLNCEIGMLTPPFGLNIFVSVGIFNRP
ncbi:MAG: TRAP transporter large permease subunit [Lachnospiraceae bacterium]